MISNKKFSIIVVFIFVIIFIFISIPSFLIYKTLLNTKEDLDVKKAVKVQLDNDAIYNSLDMDKLLYKLELVKINKPKIIALGSSRVMQFREESFNKSFINAGGAMDNMNMGYQFLNEVIKFYKPEFIILGLDFWWFNKKHYQPELSNNSISFENQKIDLKNKIKITLSKLLKKEIDFDMFKYKSEKQNKLTNYLNIGISSIKYSNGFRKDGSYHYPSFILGDAKNSDIKFSNTFNRIENGLEKFEYGDSISKETVEILNNLVRFTEENNIKLIILIPPLANEVVEKMKIFGDKYNYISQLRRIIKNSNIENYDFHDMRNYYKNSCEFIDGFHGGDVVYQRILKNMYDKNSSISKYLNIKLIRKIINEGQGKTLTIFDKNKYKKYKENDFLELGCIK